MLSPILERFQSLLEDALASIHHDDLLLDGRRLYVGISFAQVKCHEHIAAL